MRARSRSRGVRVLVIPVVLRARLQPHPRVLRANVRSTAGDCVPTAPAVLPNPDGRDGNGYEPAGGGVLGRRGSLMRAHIHVYCLFSLPVRHHRLAKSDGQLFLCLLTCNFVLLTWPNPTSGMAFGVNCFSSILMHAYLGSFLIEWNRKAKFC